MEVPRLENDLKKISPIKKEIKCINSISNIKPISLYYDEEFAKTQKAYTHESGHKTAAQSFVFDELSSLEHQIREINLKIAHNIEILRKKEEKGKELKSILKRIEYRTIPTDTSFEEEAKNCSCTYSCSLF
ncbi:hypothetical protein SteCoe_14476 [Stentor coeruleus]|uniref:Uncharacterized protein n=1 Tax=Stentor coeruleus TaxID=5963 RepID=A0A1R2C5W0_9CILI|nr:hypothetical protein SteCoe_14476 [Stentor coeruleus]